MAPADHSVGSGVAIRLARVDEAPAISDLISRLTRHYILPEQPEGAAGKLLAWMTATAVAERIVAGRRHHVAEVEGVLAGVIATRDDTHLYLLFVDTPYQRRGIAQALWQVALAACVEASQPPRITVNASAFAAPVYLRLGFATTGPEELRDGVVTTPMAFVIGGPDSASGR
jgi:GNAT superfamily N-acetyltransferase